MKLQPGTIQALYNSQKNNPLYKNPVLQITSFSKLIMGEAEKHRYKANVSDGAYYMKAVFSSDLCPLFDDNRIQRFHLIKLGVFTIRPKENNNYLYIQSISEDEQCSAEVGKPLNITTGKPSSEASNTMQPADASSPVNHKNAPISIKRATEVTNNFKKTKDAGGCVFTNIKDLNPFQNKWIIKGRVVSRSDIKKFNSAKGEGKLFSFEMADKSGQVKCVAFSESVDIFYPLVDINKVLTITQGTIKMANKKFTSNPFDYEIQLEKGTEIQQIEDDEIPQYGFSFVKIKDLVVGAALVDVVAVIKEVFPKGSIVVKSTGKELVKRDLIVIDETGNCRLTLWGSKAEEEYDCDSVICLKSVKVGEYNGVNLSTVGSSQIILNCDIPETIEVMTWYQSEGINVFIERPKRAPKRQFISEVKEGDQEYVTIQASVVYVKEDGIFYESCPGEGCNKKVTIEDNGNYRCEKCNYIYPQCNYRYMLSMHMGDFTGQVWVSVFDESGQILFGVSASQLKKMGEENPQDSQNLIKGLISKEYSVRLRVKDEVYNGESRKRYNCLEITPIDVAVETKKMLDIIEKIKV